MGKHSKFLRPCAAPNCGPAILVGRGLCNKHYLHFRAAGTLDDFALNALPPGIVLTIKKCGKCKRELPIDRFGLNGTERYQARRQSICKECRAPNNRVLKNRHRTSPKGRGTDLLTNARVRAASKGLIFTLDEEWIRTKLAAGCELTGLPFDLESGRSIGICNPYAPSIDRIIAGSHYTPENCRMVIAAINFGMNAWGEEIYRKVAKAHFKHRREQIKKREVHVSDSTYDLLLEHTQPVLVRRH